MTPEEAKFILEARRPDGSDDAEPQMAEALAVAKNHPEIRQWLAEQGEFDMLIAGKLSGVSAPARFRERIVAGRRVGRSRSWWSTRRVLPLAAAIALLLSIGAVWLRSPEGNTVAAFGAHAEKFIHEKWDHKFDLPESDLGRIGEWVSKQDGPAPVDVPSRVAGSKMYGCKLYEWNGHKATLVCFSASDGGTIHLVVTRREGVSNPPGASPVHFSHGEFNMAAWSRGDRVYVALTSSPRAELEKVL